MFLFVKAREKIKTLTENILLEFVVRLIGLEPTRRKALDPKSSVSTNFTTSARVVWCLLESECKGKKKYDKVKDI